MGEIIPMLAETHQVCALEMQGHGCTDAIDRPITYPNLADDVAAFMDAVGLEKSDVYGYSVGAAGLQLAIRRPEKVDHLVAASVSYDESGWRPEMVAMIPQMSPEMFAGSPMETAYRELSPNPDRSGRSADGLHRALSPRRDAKGDVRSGSSGSGVTAIAEGPPMLQTA